MWGTAPMSSTETRSALSLEDRAALLQVARQSIEEGLKTRIAFCPSVERYPAALARPAASFVTLHLDKRLRGCIGALKARRPLVADVAHNAFEAAFHDPRFPALRSRELAGLQIQVSVLSKEVALEVQSQQELIDCLRPGTDGLVLEDGEHRATFLPAVWSQIPEPGEFLQQLLQKAGLPAHHWSDTIRACRYSTESFPE